MYLLGPAVEGRLLASPIYC